MIRILSFLLIVVTTFTGCKKEKQVDQPAEDEKIIKQYIADNKLDAKGTGSGLYYVIQSQGTGKQPSSASTVVVAYKGYLSNGSVFDQSKAGGYTTALSDVIKGWQEGIPYFKKGGKGILLIPSRLGYGSQGTSGIPANSVLIFDVELLEVY